MRERERLSLLQISFLFSFACLLCPSFHKQASLLPHPLYTVQCPVPASAEPIPWLPTGTNNGLRVLILISHEKEFNGPGSDLGLVTSCISCCWGGVGNRGKACSVHFSRAESGEVEKMADPVQCPRANLFILGSTISEYPTRPCKQFCVFCVIIFNIVQYLH